MRHRFTFIAGLAMGYVLGTRAGREHYEQLLKGAQRVADNAAVRNAAEAAAQNGRQIAGRAYDSVNERLGHRLPDSVSEKVHALAGRRWLADEGWGTRNG